MKSNLGPSHEGISESAAVLLLAAKEDREFGNRLRVVLRLPSFHRKSMINAALAEMQAKGEPRCSCRPLPLSRMTPVRPGC